MSDNVLKYKGYQGTVEFNLENNQLWGKILHIKSTITYAGKTIDELKSSFCEEVDEYIDDCKTLGVDPEKPCSGVFQVRVDSETHRSLVKMATDANVSFNSIINDALSQFVNKVELTRMQVIETNFEKLLGEVQFVKSAPLMDYNQAVNSLQEQSLLYLTGEPRFRSVEVSALTDKVALAINKLNDIDPFPTWRSQDEPAH